MISSDKGGLIMYIIIGAIGVLTVVVLGYLTWVLMKEE